MALEFEDLDDFLALDEFAQEVVLGPVGQQRTIRAIFENGHYAMDDGLAPVSVSSPRLTVKAADVAGVRKGTPVMAAGTQYLIQDIQPDETPGGPGMAEVWLKRGGP